MAGFKSSRRTEKSDKPEWVIDYQRVLEGRPFTTAGMTDEEVERHTKPVPSPVKCGQRHPDGTVRRPDHCDVYPQGPWCQVSIVDTTSATPVLGLFWAHVDWSARCNMPQFRRKLDTKERIVDAGFEERRKDLQ